MYIIKIDNAQKCIIFYLVTWNMYVEKNDRKTIISEKTKHTS